MSDHQSDQIGIFHDRLRSLIDEVRLWDRAENVTGALPSLLGILWVDIQRLERTCIEVEQISRQSSHYWYNNGLAERLFLDPGIQSVEILRELLSRLRNQQNVSLSQSEFEGLEEIHRHLLQCNCQLQCHVEILNCYAITDLTHQYLPSSSTSQVPVIHSDSISSLDQNDDTQADNTVPPPRTVRFAKHTRSLVLGNLKITAQFILTSRRARKCNELCQCKCHLGAQSQNADPNDQRKSKFRRFWSTRSEICTETGCRRLDMRKRQLVVRQTAFIMREYAVALIGRGSRMKLELKVRPVIPETSDAIRYCQIGNLELLKDLILSGKASPWDTGPDGWSLLHNSAYCSSIEVVKFLLECGADKDTSEVKSRKPSHFAKFKALRYYASDQQKQLARMLQDEGDFKEDFELSPILSASLGEYDVSDTDRPNLSELLDLANNIVTASHPVQWEHWKQTYYDKSPLFLEILAVFRSGIKKSKTPTAIFHQLLEQPDTIQKWTPLLWAAYTGRIDVLRILLEAGADPGYITPSGRNVFHHASESSNVDALNLLFSHQCHKNGVDINLPDDWLETPLHLAAEQSPDMIKAYLNHGANVFARQGDGLVPLCYPRILRNPQRFENLACYLAARTDGCPEIDSVDNDGRTPIFNYLDTPNCVKLLLDRGANLEIIDNTGSTVFHYACKNNHADTLSLLLDRANAGITNVRDSDSFTPLFLSFDRKSIECARILLRRSRVLETIDKNGWTVLHHAAKSRDEACLNLALSIPELDVTSRTPEGQTAFDLMNNNQQSSALVQDVYFGANWNV